MTYKEAEQLVKEVYGDKLDYEAQAIMDDIQWISSHEDVQEEFKEAIRKKREGNGGEKNNI